MYDKKKVAGGLETSGCDAGPCARCGFPKPPRLRRQDAPQRTVAFADAKW